MSSTFFAKVFHCAGYLYTYIQLLWLKCLSAEEEKYSIGNKIYVEITANYAFKHIKYILLDDASMNDYKQVYEHTLLF